MQKEAKKLDIILNELIDQLGLGKRLEEQRVIAEFGEIMGSEFCKRARAVRIDHGVLYLQVVNSVWRQELYYQKTLIIDRLNHAVGMPIVREVIFR